MLVLTPNQVGLLQNYLASGQWEFEQCENGELTYNLVNRDYPLSEGISVTIIWGDNYLKIISYRKSDDEYHNVLSSEFDSKWCFSIIMWLEETIKFHAFAIIKENAGLTKNCTT
jgi:hypothetical protein